MTQTAESTELTLQVEAALMVSDKPLASARLAQMLEAEGSKPINAAIKQLNETYEASGRSFRIEQVADGWQILTLPEFGNVLAAVQKTKAQTRLSPAAMETLAIVAYKQPVLRAEIEAIRGVACGEVLRSLMERKLVKIAGRAEEIGRPILYGTTRKFLELFGLASVKDLPPVEQFNIKPPAPPAPPATPESSETPDASEASNTPDAAPEEASETTPDEASDQPEAQTAKDE